MKIGIIANDVVPGMGLPCSGQGVRALGTAKLMADRGVEVDILLQLSMLAQRAKRWSSFKGVELPNFVRLFTVSGLAELLDSYDLLILHNWAAGHGLRELRGCGTPILYDFFSPTIVEHEFFDRGEEYMNSVRERKRKTIGLASLFWGNGAGRVSYASSYLAGEGRDAEVLNAPMWFPRRTSRRRPIVTLGGFTQAWTAGVPTELVRRLAEELPDYEVVLLGGGEHYHLRENKNRVDTVEMSNVRAMAPICFEDYVCLMQSSCAFVDVAPLNDERRLSFSSRAVVALACGCPVVHNRETDLGEVISRHEAGVAVASDADACRVELLVDAIIECAQADRSAGCASLNAELEAQSYHAIERTLELVGG